jgi:hypothetical protein
MISSFQKRSYYAFAKYVNVSPDSERAVPKVTVRPDTVTPLEPVRPAVAEWTSTEPAAIDAFQLHDASASVVLVMKTWFGVKPRVTETAEPVPVYVPVAD